MKKYTPFFIVILILISALQSFRTIEVSKANPETILCVSPFTTTIYVGKSFSVNVSVQDIFDLYAFHLFLGYNTMVLDALSIYIYPPFNRGPILPPIIDDSNGYVVVSGNIGLPSSGVSGSFPIVKITFNATTHGNSVLDLYNADLRDSMSNLITHLVVDGEVSIFPPVTRTNFVLEVTEVQCSVSREGGITYFKLPTWSLFGPNTIVYDNVKQAVWMTSTNVTYGEWGDIETFNSVIVMLNVIDDSALLYNFPLYVGGGFKGLGLSSCTLDNDGNVWIAIDTCFWVPEEQPESIPSLAKLYPENNTLTVFWLPKEFGWTSDVKFHNGNVWCQSEKYLIEISGDNLADFWKISDNPSYGRIYVNGDYIWITLYDANEVKRFSILTGTFDVNFTSINSPLGICGNPSYTFVAEYDGNSIMAISNENLAYSLVQVDKTPNYVCCTIKENIWWSSPNSSIGVMGKIYNYTFGIKCKSSGSLTEGPNNTIWFSGRNYNYYLGWPYVTCNLYICMRSDIRSPDVNSDGVVNMRDATEMVLVFNSKEGDGRYKPQCDVDGDGVVTMRDIVLAILHFNERGI